MEALDLVVLVTGVGCSYGVLVLFVLSLVFRMSVKEFERDMAAAMKAREEEAESEVSSTDITPDTE